MRGKRLAAVAAAGVTWASASAWAEEAPKWGGHLDFEGKAGTDRHLGEADLFLPVVQDADSLLFASLRTRLDDQSSREGNFGLGVRQMLDSGWNLGGYGYFDRRRTEYHNYFNQATLGAEALGTDWDLRANAYLPVGKRRREVDSLSTAEVSGTDIIFRGGEEHALKGFDAEIGWRVPAFAEDSGVTLRAYGGGYVFDAGTEAVPEVMGPRGRLDLTFDTLPFLWEGSRFSLGAEAQHDDPRGTQGFLSARLRIPLQSDGGGRALTAQERRMTDPIVRDIDIVSQAGTFGPGETASQLADGGALEVVSSSTTTGADLAAALVTAGDDSTVILSGTFNTGNTTVTLQSGQTVMGAGSVAVRSPSGRTATLTLSSGATISASRTGTGTAVAMGADSTLSGMTVAVDNSGNNINVYGVQADGVGVTGVTISGNTVTATGDGFAAGVIGIRLMNNSSGTVSGNTVTATNANAGNAIGVQVSDSTATVSGNTLSADTTGTEYAIYLGNANIQSGSTGNVVSSGNACGTGAAGTGTTVSYTSGGATNTCGP